MDIKIEIVKIENFRSLRKIDLALDDYNVFVGKNNSGKSNVLNALKLAFNYNNAVKEDFFVSVNEQFDFGKKIIIDVKVVPVNTTGLIQAEFNDVWSRKFGEYIRTDENTDFEFFAFRTEIAYDSDKEAFKNSKFIIDSWSNEGESAIGNTVKRDAIDGIDAIFIDAQRDISLDLHDRRSVWGRLASRIRVTEDVSNKIHKQLKGLNKKIVSGSAILKSIGKELGDTTGERKSTVEISPITRDLESLYKGMDIYYTDSEAIPTSVENLGLGVRSWAVFSTVKADVLSKTKKAAEEELAYHAFILVEEPEAHIHPQAQRQLFKAIHSLGGQKLITSHSPHILSQISLQKIRYVRKISAESKIVKLTENDLSTDDIRKIRRTVMHTRGEILFANVVILAEGETEEQSLNVFLHEYFSKEPFELGVNIIGVGGGNYLPFIRVLHRLGIKWYIFSDGEEKPLRGVKDCLKALYNIETIDLNDHENIIYIENGDDLESYLTSEGYKTQIVAALNKVEAENGFEGDYFRNFIEKGHGQKSKFVNTNTKCPTCNQWKKEGEIKDYSGEAGEMRALLDCISGRGAKTKYATAIAEEICIMKPKAKKIPGKIRTLFEKVKEDLLDMKAGV